MLQNKTLISKDPRGMFPIYKYYSSLLLNHFGRIWSRFALFIGQRKNELFQYICILILKQEVHGPHRSPEKTVQINKHIWLYHNVDKRKKNIWG